IRAAGTLKAAVDPKLSNLHPGGLMAIRNSGWTISAVNGDGWPCLLTCIRQVEVTLLPDGSEQIKQISLQIRDPRGVVLRPKSPGIFVNDFDAVTYWSADLQAP
ncbi:hypothetical protein AB4084_33970, partial [Lysobacter sp. 2RAB21]